MSIKTDRVEFLVTQESFIELMDDNDKQATRIKTLTAENDRHILARIKDEKRIDKLKALTNRQVKRTGKLTGQVDSLKSQRDLFAEAVKEIASRINALDAALEKAMIGLDWYRAEHPEDDSPMDDEFRDEVKQARQS